MSDKSYVSMAQKKCIVCGNNYDSGEILMDMRLRESLDRYTVTGMGLCPEHKKDGFVCLIEIDEAKSERMPNGNIKPENAYRTGSVAWVKNEAFEHIFKKPIDSEIVFIDQGTMYALQEMQSHADKE